MSHLLDPILRNSAELRDHPAVDSPTGQVSYGELRELLDGRTAALAPLVSAGRVVAVERPRSLGLVLDFLAILALGGVYLPVDPDLPPRRRHALLRQVRPHCRLTPDGALPGDAEAPVTDPDAAYVFFTSGSTGTPKPVLGSATGLRAFITWQQTTFQTGPGNRVAFLTTPGFDVSLRELLLPLTGGATLVIPDGDEAATDPVAWLERHHVDTVHTVPSVARAWLRQTRTSNHTLRTAFLAGEPLTAGLLADWQVVFPATREWVNLYGPTETTLAKFAKRIPATDPPADPIAVGQPLPGTRWCLIDPDGPLDGDTVRRQLATPATEGEIVILTPHASRGYLGLPEATAERFLELGDGLTAYRTGDLGRVTGSGELVVVGRADDEVKINGVRLHPAETTTALRAHPAVGDAYTLARPTAHGPQLVAYVTARNGRPPETTTLRTELLADLPPALVPARFVWLDALPTLPNGKVDRAALPDPDTPAAPGDAPEGAVERWVAGQWAELLGVGPVGATDDFFALGGDSLVATQLAARVAEEFGVELGLRRIFAGPTVRAVAAEIIGLQLGATDEGELLALLDALEAEAPDGSAGGRS